MQIASARYVEIDHKKKIYYFPDDFAFGVSTLAFQIEGAWNEGDGTDNNINKEGVLYYRTLFKELIKANVTPVVTLYHWDLPTIFVDLGGWSNPILVDYFEDYARTSFRLFGDLVKYWLTLNEPHQHCVSSYGGSTIPGLKLPGVALYLCTHNILLAHARVYRMYKKEFYGKIALPLDCNWSMPKHHQRPEDHEAAERHLEMHIKALKGSSHFFSLNHYTTYLISQPSIDDKWQIPSYDHDTGVKVEQDLSWSVPGVSWLSVYAPGIRKMIKWITEKYGNEIPIIVTENGVSDKGQVDDYDRVS
ncbi:unnamed protein product [Spodoptera exigua]|nr:unnamed protein product [Spodoptera exigua]